MKLGMITDSVPDLDFQAMLALARRVGLDSVEFGCGNWSSAPHLDRPKLLADKTARDAFVGAIADHGLQISALNCSGNQLHPGQPGQAHDQVVRETIQLAGLLGVERVVMMSGCPGHFATHIRRMRKLYLDRQRYLIATAASRLGNLLEVPPCDAGMHAIGWLNAGVSDLAVSSAAAEAGVVARPLSSFFHTGRPRGGALLLGYAAPSPRQVREGMEVLARVIKGFTP